jgi:hypothetical protein
MLNCAYALAAFNSTWFIMLSDHVICGVFPAFSGPADRVQLKSRDFSGH